MTDDYLNRFAGIARLYGQSALERFSTSHAMIIGLGGVGSWVAEALARSGIGKFSLVDLDDLCVTNINRQIHATTETIGKSKAVVLAERLRAINPGVEIIIRQAFYSERTSDEILLTDKPHVVLDAIDSSRDKAHLLATCRDHQIPVITSGGAGGRRDATQVKVDDLSRAHGDSLLSGIRRQLRTRYRFPAAKKKGGKFRIPAVFSPEHRLYPTCDGSTSHQRPEGLKGGLKCDAGFGAATHVTATFGNIMAGLALEELAK
ncbi:tRNA threonylcarbamoyladenosine dehydratase [Akkermansiaceae bacterium]|nr:tRNA threonylcarbamoyladenosine dehydratase [Akkermansiaceae bacterium]